MPVPTSAGQDSSFDDPPERTEPSSPSESQAHSLAFERRKNLADKLRANKHLIAGNLQRELFQHHSLWVNYYGPWIRSLCSDDVCFHVDFLAGAIELGNTAPFEDYTRWCIRVLRSRGVVTELLLKSLELLGKAVQPFLSPEEYAQVLQVVRAGADSALHPDMGPILQNTRGPLAPARDLFLQALLQGQRQPAAAFALEAMQNGFSLQEVYTEIIQESLFEIGQLWEKDCLLVAQEHMATAVAHYVMDLLYANMTPPAVRHANAVITGVKGELHQIGANMVADVLEADGWNVQFLGTNMPVDGILRVIETHEATLVGISATMTFNISGVRELIQNIRKHFPSQTPRILVGGSAFRHVAESLDALGADGIALDLQTARAMASAS